MNWSLINTCLAQHLANPATRNKDRISIVSYHRCTISRVTRFGWVSVPDRALEPSPQLRAAPGTLADGGREPAGDGMLPSTCLTVLLPACLTGQTSGGEGDEG